MDIKYAVEGRSLLEKYLKFKLNFITSFCNIVLPLKISNDKSIKEKLYNYYILTNFEKIDFDKVINDRNTSLNQIFNKNNIRIKEVRDICFCLIDIDTLFEWKSDNLDAKEIKYRKSLIDMATTIYIAILYDEYILQNRKSKLSFEDISNKITNKLKGIVEVDLLIKLREKKDSIEKLFNDTILSNNKFTTLLKDYSTFKGKLYRIENPNNEKLYLSSLEYNIKEFSSENKNEVIKISNRDTIKTGLKKIEIDFNTLFIGMSILNNIEFNEIIELNVGFLSNKNNSLYLINRLNILKHYIYLSIPYDSLEKYGEQIDLLKSKGFNIIMHQSEKNVEKSINDKDIKDCNYFIIDYSDNDEFGNILSKLKENKVKAIVKNVKSKVIAKNKDIEYYTLLQGVKDEG